jgi:hypothetical protein
VRTTRIFRTTSKKRCLGTLAACLAIGGPATLPPATQAAAHTPARPASFPNYSKKVNLKVRCGKFVGEVKWGGLGGLLNKAFIDITGTVSSSCNSRTYARVGYHNSFLGGYGPTVFGTANAHKTAKADFSTSSVDGTYSNIYVQACTTDGMPKGKLLCKQANM